MHKTIFGLTFFYKEKLGPTEIILIIIGLYKLLGPYLHFIFHIN